jgi:DNA-binding beta-propeller fold protein YncE
MPEQNSAVRPAASRVHIGWRAISLLAALVAILLSLLWAAGAKAAPPGMRDVVLVGNAASGTVTLLDGHQPWTNLGYINVTPDPVSPTQQQQYDFFNSQEGGVRAVDDAIASPNGKKLYVSRANRGDVAAFNLVNHQMLWRTPCSGFRCDHMALSPDGSQLIVSATLAMNAQVLNTDTGAVVASFPTGTFPHQNDYSADGRHIMNESIGNVALPQSMEAAKGLRQLTVVDAHTFQPVHVCQLQHGLRPTVFLPNGIAYMELSYLNGFVVFDTNTCQILRTINQPFANGGDQLSPDQYPLNSAHHGMALSGDGTKLCDVGTIDNYVAVVSTASLSDSLPIDQTILNVGRKPYWGQTSVDGNYCFVSNSDDNDVWVVQYTPAAAVTHVNVGAFPQRERIAVVPDTVVSNLTPPSQGVG